MVKLIAYRLYLSAQVLVTGLSAAFLLWWVIAEIHDRYVAATDFECLDKWQRGSGASLGAQRSEAEMMADLATADAAGDAQLAQHIAQRIKALRASKPSDWSIVEVPDLGSVSFPSTMSQEQMEARLNEFERYGWCHLKTDLGQQSYKRAWHIEAGRRTRTYHQQDLLVLAAAVIAPLSMFGVYRWVSWIARPPPST